MVVGLQLPLGKVLGNLFDGRSALSGGDQAAFPSLLARVGCWQLKQASSRVLQAGLLISNSATELEPIQVFRGF